MRHGRLRFTALDAVLIALLAIAAVWFVYRISVTMQYRWQWPILLQYLWRREDGHWLLGTLGQGFLMTLKLSLWATLLALMLGTGMGLLRVSRGLFRRLVGTGYVELVRNLPPLVLVFIVYYFLGEQLISLLELERFMAAAPPALREAMSLLFAPPARLPAFLAGLATLVLYEGAYIAEIVRAGIESLEKGQWEAAFALGLTRRQQLRFVILPQALQRTLPALAGQLISTIKDSALVSVISIPELTFQGLEIMSATYLTFEVWTTIAGLYFLLTFACSLGVRRLEAATRRA